jgi:hypothetical protein
MTDFVSLALPVIRLLVCNSVLLALYNLGSKLVPRAEPKTRELSYARMIYSHSTILNMLIFSEPNHDLYQISDR